MMKVKRISWFLICVCMLCSASLAQNITTPERGSKLRKTLIDAVREPVSRELKQPVIFRISEIKVSGIWAFISGEPLTPAGGIPDYSDTIHAEAVTSDMFDNNVFALLKKQGSEWIVVQHLVGCTDVCYSLWPEEFPAPRALFGFPEVDNADEKSSLEPEKGSYLRKTLIDALRKPVVKDLKQQVIFKVDSIRVSGRWAFIAGEPLQPSGSKPDYEKTQYRNQVRSDMFGNNVFGLLKQENGTWRVIRYEIGCTDVCYLGWHVEYGAPKGIFPYSDQN